jgi:hypothetical protein
MQSDLPQQCVQVGVYPVILNLPNSLNFGISSNFTVVKGISVVSSVVASVVVSTTEIGSVVSPIASALPYVLNMHVQKIDVHKMLIAHILIVLSIFKTS